MPRDYLEVSKVLLDIAADDIASSGSSSPDRLRLLLKDIREARQSKIRRGLGAINSVHLGVCFASFTRSPSTRASSGSLETWREEMLTRVTPNTDAEPFVDGDQRIETVLCAGVRAPESPRPHGRRTQGARARMDDEPGQARGRRAPRDRVGRLEGLAGGERHAVLSRLCDKSLRGRGNVERWLPASRRRKLVGIFRCPSRSELREVGNFARFNQTDQYRIAHSSSRPEGHTGLSLPPLHGPVGSWRDG